MILTFVQILGTIVSILVPGIVTYWKIQTQRASKKKFNMQVTRRKRETGVGTNHANILHKIPLLHYMEIDKEFAAAHYPGVPMMSLGEYMSLLDAQVEVSLQRVLVTIMDRFGLRIALPLALFAPPSWQRDGNGTGVLKQFPAANAIIENGISALGLLAISAVSQKSKIDMMSMNQNLGPGKTEKMERNLDSADESKKFKATENALGKMLLGSTDFELCRSISSPLTIDDNLIKHCSKKIDEDSKGIGTGNQDPIPIHAVFPDLHLGNGGLKRICSESQAISNTYFAIICNRLMGNALIGRHSQSPVTPFVVRLPPNKQDSSKPQNGSAAGISHSNCHANNHDYVETSSLEHFIRELENREHKVSLRIVSTITSFGVGFSVKEKSNECSYIQIPLAYPIDTGLLGRYEDRRFTNTNTLMSHASFRMIIEGPLITAQVEWCLSVSGFTGWLPLNGVARPWQLSSGSFVYHSEEYTDTAEDRQKALRLITASSVVSNIAASKGQLMFGGYGKFIHVLIRKTAVVSSYLLLICTHLSMITNHRLSWSLLRFCGCYSASFDWIMHIISLIVGRRCQARFDQSI